MAVMKSVEGGDVTLINPNICESTVSEKFKSAAAETAASPDSTTHKSAGKLTKRQTDIFCFSDSGLSLSQFLSYFTSHFPCTVCPQLLLL